MATHSSILAWEIPWTEKPGGPQSMGGRKESDMTKLSTAAAVPSKQHKMTEIENNEDKKNEKIKSGDQIFKYVKHMIQKNSQN